MYKRPQLLIIQTGERQIDPVAKKVTVYASACEGLCCRRYESALWEGECIMDTPSLDLRSRGRRKQLGEGGDLSSGPLKITVTG